MLHFTWLPSELLIDNVSISEPKDEQSALSERFDFKWQLTKSSDYFYLLPGLSNELKSNPFVNETRRFDVDLGCNKTLLISLNLQLPEGIITEALPKNITFIKSDSTISFRRISDVNGSTLRNMIRIEYKESQFPKEEYPYLKEFYAKMYELLNEPIILRKKK